MTFVAWDTETAPVIYGNLAPKIICLSWATFVNKEWDPEIVTDGDPYLDEAIMALFESDDTFIGHFTAYDATCALATVPAVTPLIFKAYEDGRMHCTVVRQKLINLSKHGKLDKYPEGGSRRDISYGLADLVLEFFGRDRTAEKKDEDSWRAHYQMLSGKPAEDYPDEALEYALQDAVDTGMVFMQQEHICKTHPTAQVTTQELRAAADFALRLESCWGLRIDHEMRDRIRDRVMAEYEPEATPLLLEAGIVRPGIPPKPYRSGAKNSDGTPKMTKGKRPSRNMKVLHGLIEKICEEHKIPVKRTEKDGVATDADWLAQISIHSPVLQEYEHRQALAKIAETELPRLSMPTAHPMYDVIKETGRTSSRKSKTVEGTFNGQNVDPRARPCYIPRPGCVFVGVDYSMLELCSVAQKTFNLFGESHHLDLINEGIDLHAYLGAQLALRLDDTFQGACNDARVSDPRSVYQTFHLLADSEYPEAKRLYKHFRTMAKPTGLGFPGGLGPETFVQFARASFGVDLIKITGSYAAAVNLARQLREFWHQTYPEMRRYFNWINTACQDPEFEDAYCYTTPLGMLRRNATYCACANGAAMQSPAAEGMIISVWELAKACYDWTQENVLFNCRPVLEIHDENIVEAPADEKLQARIKEIQRIMQDSMSIVMPDVTIRTEAVLMERWDKRAEPVFNEAGELQIWRPEEGYK